MGFRGLAGDGGRGGTSKGATGESEIKAAPSVGAMSLLFLIFCASPPIRRAISNLKKASDFKASSAVAWIAWICHDRP
jgi:hypothetical protein